MVTGRNKKGRKKSRKGARGRKGLTFGFFLAVCFIVAGIGGFIVLQNQLTVTSELRSEKVDASIEAQRARQEDLRVLLARVKSPARVARIAQDELGMTEPDGVIYLRYWKDPQGNVVCQSTYEQGDGSPAASQTEDTQAPVTSAEPAEAITKR